ncbi:MAG: transcription-repair coupling factor [Bacteroidales bacterium]|nr:transcription-repair coupling factor [Bacteroidales bacterium]
MNSKEFNTFFRKSPAIEQLSLDLKQNRKIALNGAVGSFISVIIAQIFKIFPRHILVICDDPEEAAYLRDDLSNLIGTKNILFFPSSYKRSILYEARDEAGLISRTEVLNALNGENHHQITITYPEALIEKVVSKAELSEKTLQLAVGEKLSTDFINDILFEYNFERSDFVFQPGQYSIRGSIIDIFSYASTEPFRIDFFGDEVESIRTFDVETQLSKELLQNITIVPDIQVKKEKFQSINFLEFIPQNTFVFTKNLITYIESINDLYEKSIEHYKTTGVENFGHYVCTGNIIAEYLKNLSVIEYGLQQYFESDNKIHFNTSPQPSFSKNFELLGNALVANTENGYTNLIASDNITQIERLTDIFTELNSKVKFQALPFSLHAGFVDNDLRICCFTDHQIFERYHRQQNKKKIISQESLSIRDINKLQPGDYVVHVDHGIGRFAGLEKIEVNDRKQEAVKLIYQDNDVLYVSIHNLHRIAKFKGGDGGEPRMHKLGSGIWQRTKQKAKSKVKDIAKELIVLYAERKSKKGYAFSPDCYLQQELEASFFYEDTPDQLKATKAVKKAMEDDCPMDMLICGDVGFGKTEIAVRAAYKAVTDSKQVAILVPTTILALQHYKTFSNRLKDLACRVEYISRLKTAKQQTQILKDLKEGKIDILIGTHRIVGKDIEFRDLGLLIIDEEQKFGVSIKEKLKHIKVNVDTLTLTATPIPRTLQFSLMGARDLSIINTPPPNRHPIITEVHTFNEAVIKEAIIFEINRNGQVFIINNRIQNIYELEALINRLCPGVRTIVGHGQMDGTKLESIMLDFITGEYDVLIATTIIESGLDIPNANTIIINDAQNFGLSELHQLRGRVGRSNKKALCYMLAPPLHVLTPEARRRLHAIEEFSDLGSGFSIALQDLDIRGAGNVLGAEQSGFISDIGIETYQKILDEAMQELRENDYKEFYSKNQDNNVVAEELPLDFKFVTDSVIETDFILLFPEDYITNTSERVNLYRELDNISSEDALIEFEKNIKDRFGSLPDQCSSLLQIVRLRWLAINLGIEKIVLKKNTMINYFVSNQASPFYHSPIFSKILEFVQQNPKYAQLTEKNNKLTLRFDAINSVEKAIQTLQKI